MKPLRVSKILEMSLMRYMVLAPVLDSAENGYLHVLHQRRMMIRHRRHRGHIDNYRFCRNPRFMCNLRLHLQPVCVAAENVRNHGVLVVEGSLVGAFEHPAPLQIVNYPP